MDEIDSKDIGCFEKMVDNDENDTINGLHAEDTKRHVENEERKNKGMYIERKGIGISDEDASVEDGDDKGRNLDEIEKRENES